MMDEQKVADLFEVKKWHFAKTIPRFRISMSKMGRRQKFNEVLCVKTQ